jgi:hypothetical protein
MPFKKGHKPYNYRHGLSGTNGAYKIWCGMRSRCLYEGNPAFNMYGGRGIKICERWMKFENFLEDMGQPQENQSIDRIDNNGHYEPSNCRWATQSEQNNNYSRNRLITYDGITQNMNQWSLSKGWYPRAIQDRLQKGWDIERAMTQPIRNRRSQ